VYIPNAFIQTEVDGEIIIRLVGNLSLALLDVDPKY